MSLLSALSSGISGLRTYGTSLQTIGNNIANINTVGFKAQRTEFGDLFGQSLSRTGSIGRGVTVDRITTIFSQGSFSNTERLTDLAVDGSGFFILSDGQQDVYTRNGQFSLDRNGFLVNSSDFRVQGTIFDPLGSPIGTGDLQLTAATANPRATSDGTVGPGIQMNLNLDASGAVTGPFDGSSVLNAELSSNFSTSLSVFDSLGNSHSISVYFTKTADNAWDWNALVDGADITGGTPGTPVIGASGTLTFDSEGILTAQTQDAVPNWDFDGGPVQDQFIGLDMGVGLGGTTQFASPSVINSQSQDGFAAGSLGSVAIDPDGTIVGFFTNGQTQAIGQLLLADFSNEEGLAPSGRGMFRETLQSGSALVGTPGTGEFGRVATQTLELSNVDLANEFVGLVTNQRAFQANTRIITTVDQLLNDVVNIIR